MQEKHNINLTRSNYVFVCSGIAVEMMTKNLEIFRIMKSVGMYVEM